MSGGLQQGWGSGDTSQSSVGRMRASDVSSKLRASKRAGSAKEEGFGKGKRGGQERYDVERSGKTTEKEGHASETS